MENKIQSVIIYYMIPIAGIWFIISNICNKSIDYRMTISYATLFTAYQYYINNTILRKLEKIEVNTEPDDYN